MRRTILYFSSLFLISTTLPAQIVTLSPERATAEDSVVVIFDASKGNAGLIGAEKVYMHSGLVISGPDGTEWEFVIGNWGQDDGVGQMTQVTGNSNKWQLILAPSLREYQNAPEGTNYFRLAMVFRNADGSAKGIGNPGDIDGGIVAENGDIYLDLAVEEFIRIVAPQSQELFLDPGDSLVFTAEASSQASQIKLLIDEGSGFQEVATIANATTLSFSYFPQTSGTISVKYIATINTMEVEVSEDYLIILKSPSPEAALPAGLINGINYDPADDTKVILVLLAPGKEFVYVNGDFSNWEISDTYLMNKTPDGKQFWLELTGLEPGREYIFQYWVDGTIKIGDPFADKVVDPYNDAFIPDTVYPNLIEYNKTEFGIATVFQTGQQQFAWSSADSAFQRPDKNNLIVYELLIRDFIGSHDYKDLTDTLHYLKRLGVNAIELMPVMEFEGNDSWGYNPSYFFAPDKYYGTKNDLKAFIDKAHTEGFAVILDMVLNHAFGQNAMVRMYWDGNKPAVDNPWFNQEATHPFSVGFDFNHESTYTQAFVDSVNAYWLKEYHFDGFRFDLSKGFTQNVTTDVGAWGNYDQSRIDLLIRMATRIKEYDTSAYIILEHFASPDEEKALSDLNMILWNNLNHTYSEVLSGTNSSGSFSGADRLTHISYMESHDEQRLSYTIRNGGTHLGTYDIKSDPVALDRVKLGAAFFYLVPGPKLLWQFQELGYDIDINFNGRLGIKPQPWGAGGLGYYENTDRQKLYKAVSAIIRLRNDYPQVFKNGSFNWTVSGEARKINITHPDLEITVIGNFGLAPVEIDPNFSTTGIWYDYFSSDSIDVTDQNLPIKLMPGEFHIFVDRMVTWPESGLVEVFQPVVISEPASFHQQQQVRIVFDATQADPNGTGGLAGAEKVYFHSGVFLDPNDTTWSFTVGNPGMDDGIGEMTKVSGETDKWEITLTPQDYYGVPAETRIFKMAMFFRDATGQNVGTAAGGKDIVLHVEADPSLSAVWTQPEIFNAKQQITIFFDATLADPAGTPGLTGASKVYMHSGIITSSPTGTSWQNVIGNWGQDDGVGAMSNVPGQTNQWQISLTPWTYYDVADGTTVYRLGMVFRNEDGSREGKDEGAKDFFINVDQTITGLDAFEQSGVRLRVYPNPAERMFVIHLPEPEQSVRFRLFDAQGKLVDMRYYISPGGIREIEYSTTLLKTGIYFIEILGKTRYTGRVIIEK